MCYIHCFLIKQAYKYLTQVFISSGKLFIYGPPPNYKTNRMDQKYFLLPQTALVCHLKAILANNGCDNVNGHARSSPQNIVLLIQDGISGKWPDTHCDVGSEGLSKTTNHE